MLLSAKLCDETTTNGGHTLRKTCRLCGHHLWLFHHIVWQWEAHKVVSVWECLRLGSVWHSAAYLSIATISPLQSLTCPNQFQGQQQQNLATVRICDTTRPQIPLKISQKMTQVQHQSPLKKKGRVLNNTRGIRREIIRRLIHQNLNIIDREFTLRRGWNTNNLNWLVLFSQESDLTKWK